MGIRGARRVSLIEGWAITQVDASVLLLLAACASCQSDRAPEDVAQSSAALGGPGGPNSSIDASDVRSDVVVEFSQEFLDNQGNRVEAICSGTMVTPTLVLTANHCITGGLMQFKPPWGLKPPVIITDPIQATSITIVADTSVVRLNGPVSGQDVSSDLALVKLPEASLISAALTKVQGSPNPRAALEKTDWAATVHVAATHPSFALPTTDPAGQTGSGHYMFPSGLFAAGFGQYTPSLAYPGCSQSGVGPVVCPDQARELFSFQQLERVVASVGGGLSAGLWKRPPQEPGDNFFVIQGGDSGGPIFSVRADGTRDVVGVTSNVETDGSTGAYQDGVWVDITSSDAMSWIELNAVDPGRQQTAHPVWFAQHPLPAGQTEWWLGDVEYTGTCREDDTDCDHWTDVHDNCPYVFNPDQVDGNDQGVGDACASGCPCDPHNDIDRDRVCGPCNSPPVDNGYCPQYCATPPSLIDNCPYVANANQANCNAEAENVRGATTWGDACDPVPCPNSSASALDQARSTGGCTGEPHIAQLCSGRHVHDIIHTDTVGSNVSESLVELTGAPVLSQPTANVVDPITTDSRFCQSNVHLPQPFNCHDRQVINDTELSAFSSAAAEIGTDPSRPWHRITVSGTFTAPGTTGRGGTWQAEYGLTSRDQVWDFQGDNAFWASVSPARIPPPDLIADPGCVATGGTCLDGAFWSHAETPVGDTQDTVLEGSGSFTRIVTVGLHGAGLANHYFDMRPDAAYQIYIAGPGQILNPGPAVHWINPGDPWVNPGDPWEWQTTPDPETLVTVTVVGQPSLYALQHDGSGIDVSSALSPTLRAEVTNRSLVWVNAVEPLADVGRLSGSLQAVALSSDGTTVVDRVLSTKAGLQSARDAGGLAAPPGVDPPAPRRAFQAVLSRAAGGVFVLGGQDASTGVTLHDAWMQLVGQAWRQLVFVGAQSLREVLASTFSYGDLRLWVLDRGIGDHDEQQLRLLRIDPFGSFGATTEIVATWEQRFTGSYWLAVDKDGSVLLTVGLPGGHASRTARIDVADTPRVVLVHTEPGALAQAPIADSSGYSFVVAQPDGSLRIHREKRLSGVCCDDEACRGDDHGDRNDGERACRWEDMSGRF